MDIPLILISALVATSAMTAFSYFYSSLVNRQFREPELLNILLQRMPGGPKNLAKTSLLGWLLHFFVGVIFMVAFYLIWEKSDFEPSWISGILLGFLAGVLGVIGWQLTFWIHPNPPEIAFKHYYTHLILAHIIFGMGAFISYNLLS